MTFGIDVSQYQWPIDYAQAKREGVEFVIVKAAGYNTGSLYVAGRYSDHIDAAKAAGLPTGHYYVVGAGNPTTQADFFVDHLHRFDKNRDVLALDNEPLDSNGTFWHQNDAYTFLARVQSRTGIPWSRLWLYCPASLTRSNPPWTKITNPGGRIWWASYGGNPGGKTPDHSPNTEGSVDAVDVHQFTSLSVVAGVTVDGNHSTIAASTLFGGGGSSNTGKGTKVMYHYHFEDRSATTLQPGAKTFLHNDKNDRDQNVVGGIGKYSITAHMYAEGLDEGDSLEVALVWENTKWDKPSEHASDHYTETVRANRDGFINVNFESKRNVASGDMVFVRVTAPASNKKPAKVTLIDSDAYLFA